MKEIHARYHRRHAWSKLHLQAITERAIRLDEAAGNELLQTIKDTLQKFRIPFDKDEPREIEFVNNPCPWWDSEKFSVDLFGPVFSYCGIVDLNRSRLVCKRWKQNIDKAVSTNPRMIITCEENYNSMMEQKMAVLKNLLPSLHDKLTQTFKNFPYTVYVKTLTGKTITIPGMNVTNTVLNLKNKIQDKEGIPSTKQRLVFCGLQLEDDLMLCEVGILAEVTIHLVIREIVGRG